ncbi:MAG: MFS transporter [Planctomycetales bacterium]
MNRAILILVLMVSSGHALVHIFESAYPSVEQIIGQQFSVDKLTLGWLGTCWRVPFGAFALIAGWLTDRYGARRTLVAYLFGCSAMAVCASLTSQFDSLFVMFFMMGMFASIYHPAGLALISHVVPRSHLPRALGIHGIFGSIGIGGGPLLAAIVLSCGIGWRGYFMFLAIPGALLGGLFLFSLKDGHHRPDDDTTDVPEDSKTEHKFLAVEYTIALFIAAFSGFVYAGIINFLPRYLSDINLMSGDIPKAGMRNLLTAGVLILGVIGQSTSGWFARPHTLERWLSLILFAVAPCLLAMGIAQGAWKIVAAGAFSVVYFMSQPVYNSLIPKYVPARRRSLGYGLNFSVTFGLGAFGAAFSGWASSQWVNFGVLALCSTLAGCLAVVLWWRAQYGKPAISL